MNVRKPSKGIKLWKKAKKLIPGGTQLLSKRAEMFLPEQWPSYFRRAKGVEVWDLDGNRYIDTYMGIGACILGYSDDDVNEAVKKVINEGSMCTLNSPEEVELAELLLKLHPWAEMVRYTRTGGEAMAVAVRIARAYTRKDKIAFCGYHGWHDWYLAANLADERSLDGHLLPGLKPLGVPRVLKGTALPFHYNKIEELEKIIQENDDIGVIVMEPRREQEPKNGFLQKVRKIADEIGAVLIFDEISSGWRMNVGGIHMLYGVYPDIAVFGKAMSNGFPMGAVIGRGEVMDVAQESFISSTYWTERIGPAAAIATIRKLKRCRVPAHVRKIGEKVMKGWKEMADENGLKLEVVGMPALATYKLGYGEINQEIYTLFTQEMLERGFLASKSFYVSYSHTEECIEKYLGNVDEVFEILAKAIADEKVQSMLKGPVAHAGFKRLT